MQNITHNMDETKDDTEILSSSYKSFFFSYWFSISSLHEVKGKTEIANHFSLTHHNTHLSSSFSLHSLFFALCSFHLRYNFALQAKTKRSSIEHLSKTYRRPIEDLSNIYRRPIEDLSKMGWRGSGEGAEEEFGYKVTKFRSLIFTFLVVSVT